GLNVGVINHDISYLVEWENPELAQNSIDNNLSAWPNEYIDEEIPPEKNIDIISSFKTTLVPSSRQQAYRAEITYGTNNEFGFDYLRDNMKFSLEDYVQSGHNFAIVDEVDSILIDEARTPLIISGPSEDSTDLYYKVDAVVKRLNKETDFTIDEKTRQVDLTDEGSSKVEVEKALDIPNLYDPTNLKHLHHVNQALKAHTLFNKDVDYMMQDGKVIIVDEFTGRLMPGRRWSDGLHQAVEAKEGVEIESENQTLATITIQNYFRMYRKLAGMTGTADTEAFEFKNIYKLDVTVIPTHKPLIRNDQNDVIYKTQHEKYNAACDEIKELHTKGVPILVGTASIEQSEKVSKYLDKLKFPYQVLNAKHHEKEAEIVAQAGRLGAITIATNMAGRGTDILLGGNPEFLARDIINKKFKIDPNDANQQQYEEALLEAKSICDDEKKKVKEMGGLHILAVERHEARRIDNQLRGRAGRQGDEGSSRFYVSLEDDLMRIFASEKITGVMDKLGWKEGEPIEHGMIDKSIENAQKKVEGRNFDIRKHLLQYDDVLNTQRDVVYKKRREVLEGGDNLKDMLLSNSHEISYALVESHIPDKSDLSEENYEEIQDSIKRFFNIDIDLKEITNGNKETLIENIYEKVEEFYNNKE
nr:preprotein translocase subunit SecA [Candidatus Dadabacteria bacterium]NIQ12944.1 preprotein translocase subunit SecA [Candidatus Dadabacteria bacterium]